MTRKELIEYIKLVNLKENNVFLKMPVFGTIWYDEKFKTVDEAIENGELKLYDYDWVDYRSEDCDKLRSYFKSVIKKEIISSVDNFTDDVVNLEEVDDLDSFISLVDDGTIDLAELEIDFKNNYILKKKNIIHVSLFVKQDENIDWIETKYSLEELRDIVNEKNQINRMKM